MPSTGSTAAQRPPAPRDSGSSYSSRHQQAKNQPDLSGRLVYADPRSLPSFPSVGVKLDSTNTAALMASTTKSPPAIFDVSGPANPASLKAATAAAAASAALTSAKSTNAKPALSTDVPEAAQSKNITQSSPTRSIGSSELPPPTSTSANAAASSNNSSNMTSTKPTGASTAGWGNSAATQAFRNSQILSAKRASAPPEKPIPEIAALGHQPSLRAAKGAMKSASNPSSASAAASASLSHSASTSNAAAAGATGAVSGNTPTMRTRSRAHSTPLSLRQQKSLSSHYPDSTITTNLSGSPPDPKVSAANALSAATIAHTKSQSGGDRRSYVGDAGAVPYTTMGRQMYTSHPSIGPEVDIQKHQDGLHASAIAMAKQMYNPKAEGGATGVAVPNVQEQAYRLAQERLEKIHEQHAKDREYRDHYVDPKMGVSSGAGESSRRLSMRGRLRRRRSSSDSDISLDHQRSMEIRNQMSLLSNRISEVEDKRRRDRQNVLLAAQRNVKSQLKNIDEQVYVNSGRLPPSAMASLDQTKITSIAQARADAQIGAYPRSDQVDIGGGKFMDRTEVDKIATRRMQPVIDDMHEKARVEVERKALLRQEEEERKAKQRQENEERKAEAAMLKARDKEMKETYKQLKKDEKARKAEEKAAAKQAKRDGKLVAAGSKDEQLTNGKGKAEVADADMMTAPDTSVGSTSGVEASSPEVEKDDALKAKGEPSGARGDASPDSPTVPVAVLAVPMVATSTEAAGASTSAPSAAAAPTTPATASKSITDDRNEASTENTGGSSSGRRLSKLFVKTPKENSERKRSESNSNAAGKVSGAAVAGAAGVVGAAGAIGAGAASQAKSVVPGTNGSHSTSAPADKASTPKSPMSPLSDNESSPNSNKVKSWFKSRFTRDRSKSSASATGAPSAAASGKAPSIGAASSPAAASGPTSTGQSKALGTAAASDQRSTTEKSFVGGHALTGAESPTPQGRSSGPAIGSGGLTMPLVTGGAIAAAGGATAAGLSSSKEATSGTGQDATGQRDSAANITQQFYTSTSSQRQSGGGQSSSPTDRYGDNNIFGGSERANIPEAAETTGITTAKDSTEKDAAALAQEESPSLGHTPGAHGNAATSFGLGPLTPVIMGPGDSTPTSGTAGATEKSSSLGLPGSAALAAGAAGTTGAAGASGAALASGHSGATGVTLKEGSNTDYMLPGNRQSYASSNYSADAGVPGVAGSGFGLVGANIFANISSTVPTEKGDNGNTFVSVPPPTSATTATSGAESGAFTPPKAIRDPAEKKSASPVRDSRFLENLEELS
ncbi:Eisosome assembly protein [Sporothrix bragantina]|uniref:Eisosome assembly protein n=1 Tax=Sporothrix bragantina TaxID=671064 RepID=A0ABP0AW43_9PEZI